MSSGPPTNEDELDRLISYQIDADARSSEAVVDAFLEADVDVFRKPTVLEDWISTDALDQFTENTAGTSLSVSARIWDHRVRITDEVVCIYTDADPQSTGGPDTPPPDP